MIQANAERVQGVQVQRISGKPFVDTEGEIPLQVKGKSAVAGGNQVISKKSRGVQTDQALSAINEQISTSMDSMKLELKNKLDTINARLKKVEQGSSGSGKVTKKNETTGARTIDLRQAKQAPPRVEVTEVGDDQDENESRALENRACPGRKFLLIDDIILSSFGALE